MNWQTEFLLMFKAEVIWKHTAAVTMTSLRLQFGN